MIFLDDGDRTRFLGLLAEVAGRSGWEGYAYCLMGNHFHLAFMTPQPDLPAGMRDVMGRYARGFNRAHQRTGHVFGGRYQASLIVGDRHLLGVIRYIALNPVVAGLVAHPAEWHWGSYRLVVAGSAGGFVSATTVLGLFHRHRLRAEAVMRGFVMDGLPMPGQLPLRSDVAGAEVLARRPSVRQVFAAMPATDATRACASLGYRHAEIAVGAGVSRSAVSHRLRAV